MTFTPENTQAAQAALDYLTEHPEKHNQASWVDAPWSLPADISEFETIFTEDGYQTVTPAEVVNLCDTTMCVAGTVQFLHRGWVNGRTAPIDGAAYLGLDGAQAHFLFYDATNEEAIDGLTAIAQGDPWKFNDVMDRCYQRGDYAPENDPDYWDE